jgi:hypothetical protein
MRDARLARRFKAAQEPLERRMLLAAGAEFQVNTYTSSNQYSTSVAMDPTGNFVVAWISPQDGSGYGVYAQRFNAAGVPQGPEFAVNSYTTGAQGSPSVAMDSHGNFVIVWDSAQDGSVLGVYGQRFGATGVPLGSEFRVNTFTTSAQRWPKVAMNALGDFVVTWTSNGQEGSSYGVYARRYNAAGTVLSGEFLVNTYTTSFQQLSSIAMDTSGDFVIAWHSFGQDGSGTGIYARRYDSAGSPQGGEFRANTHTTGGQALPSLAMDGGGDFVIAWECQEQDGSSFGVYAQRYNALGVAQGGEFLANTRTADSQRYASVAMDGDGDFLVSWNSQPQDGSAYGIYAQRYSAAGVPQGSEFRVNTYRSGDQRIPSAALDFDGDAVIAYESREQDGSALGIFARQYAPGPAAPAVTESAFLFDTSPQQLQFVFDQNVGDSLSFDDLVVQALPGGATIDPALIVSDPATFTATISLGGAVPDGNFRATIMGGGVSNLAGIPMAADHVLEFHFLRGDADNDGDVDVNDLGILATNWQQSPRTFSQGDFDYSGTVDVNDLGILATKWQQALPAASAVARRGQGRSIDRIFHQVPLGA